MLLIQKILPNELAEELGFSVGDKLLKINGIAVNDEIDLHFLLADEILEIEVEHPKGDVEIWEWENEPGVEFGAEFKQIQYKSCQNQCIFCFVDQMPPELRPELYLKDDDLRLSFLFGNYLTLTNFTEADFERIQQQRLSPLYISVHTTDSALRQKMCRHKKAGKILEQLKRLAALNIQLHIQIVLCLGINDGKYLEQTITDLSGLYPQVQSIAIVPVGLTKWRKKKGLYPLKPITPDYAKKLIPLLENWQKKFREKWEENFVYLADEFYLLADSPIPDSQHYGGFNQLEDGVGMVRLFLDEFEEAEKDFPEKLPENAAITLVTSQLSSKFMGKIVDRLNKIENLSVQLIVAENQLF